MILTLLCTRKVTKTYDLTALPQSSESAERPDFLHWYCNLIRLRRRHCLLFTHEQSLFSFVIYQFSKRDVANLLDLFCTHLGQAMRAESISEDAIEALMSRIAGIEFGPTQSRSVLGSMNDIMFQFRFDVEEYFGLYEVSPVLLSEVTRRTNDAPLGGIGYACPNEEFPRLLQAFLVKGVS